MRAYLSNRAERLTNCWAPNVYADEFGGAEQTDAAEAEARRILADTEPEDGNASSTWRRQRVLAPCWAIRLQTEGLALAESLARFIALPLED